jgi:uncharacterized protein (TIGR03435 family)
LIGFAYDVPDERIWGGPSWLDSARYSIEAKADSATAIPRSQESARYSRLMTQSLLAERFKLVFHRATTSGMIYELLVAKGGHKLKEAEPSRTMVRRSLRMVRGRLTATSVPLSRLVDVLAHSLGRPVIDKTGLTGTYDFTLPFTFEPDQTGDFEVLADSVAESLPPNLTSPAVFTALDEQLGLKLNSANGLVEVLIIESVEKPSEKTA